MVKLLDEFAEVKRLRLLAATAREAGRHTPSTRIRGTYDDIAVQYDILANCMAELVKHRKLH